MLKDLIDDIYLQIDEDLLKNGLSSYQKRAERFAKFIGMDVREFNTQNRARSEKYLQNLISSIEKCLDIPKPDVFPNLEEMNAYPFVRIFEKKKGDFFESEYKNLLSQFYDDQLEDFGSSEFLSNIKPACKKVGVIPKEIANLFSLERVSSNHKALIFKNINVASSGLWNICADKQSIRKPKCIRYYCVLQYSSEKKLLLDFSHFDFRALMLNAGPFPEYSKYSVNECVELEFIKQSIQLSVFQTITTALDGHLTRLRIL